MPYQYLPQAKFKITGTRFIALTYTLTELLQHDAVNKGHTLEWIANVQTLREWLEKIEKSMEQAHYTIKMDVLQMQAFLKYWVGYSFPGSALAGIALNQCIDMITRAIDQQQRKTVNLLNNF